MTGPGTPRAGLVTAALVQARAGGVVWHTSGCLNRHLPGPGFSTGPPRNPARQNAVT